MKSWFKTSVVGWLGFQLADALLSPVFKKIFDGVRRVSQRFTVQMGWS